MNISPETLTLLISGGAGGAVISQLLSRYFTQKLNSIDDVPSILMHLEYVKKSLAKVEIQLEQLNEKKEENTRKIILLEEKAKAAHKRIDRINSDA
jgi:hypothetical protein